MQCSHRGKAVCNRVLLVFGSVSPATCTKPIGDCWGEMVGLRGALPAVLGAALKSQVEKKAKSGIKLPSSHWYLPALPIY